MASVEDVSACDTEDWLAEENKRLKDKIFELLRKPQSEATASSIREAYTLICYNIDTWVMNVVDDSDPKLIHGKLGRKERKLLERLRARTLPKRRLKNSVSLLLSFEVQDLVRKFILDEPYPLGITTKQADVIDEVLQGLRSLESANDLVMAERWRSEAVRGLMAHQDFSKEREKRLASKIGAAMLEISPHNGVPFCRISPEALQKHHTLLSDEIFRAAADLQMSLRSSVHHYKVQLETISPELGSEQDIEETWRRRDLREWQDLETAGSESRPICCLYPAIVREADATGPAETICAPTIVVDSAGMTRSGTSSQDSDPWNPSTPVNSVPGPKAQGWEQRSRPGQKRSQSNSERPHKPSQDRRKETSSSPPKPTYTSRILGFLSVSNAQGSSVSRSERRSWM